MNIVSAAFSAGHKQPVTGSPMCRPLAGIRELRICRPLPLTALEQATLALNRPKLWKKQWIYLKGLPENLTESLIYFHASNCQLVEHINPAIRALRVPKRRTHF